MNMKNQVLSINQMRHLKDLGLDTSKASMCWLKDLTKEIAEGKEVDITIGWDLDFNNPDFYKYEWMEGIPTFTLQDILDLLPKEISRDGCTWSASLYIDYENNRIAYGNTDRYGFEVFLETKIENNLIDAAYKKLCWLKENDIKFEQD